VPGGDASAIAQLNAGDAIAFGVNLDDLRFFPDFAAEFARMIEEDFVIDRAIDLERCLEALAFELRWARLIAEIGEREELEISQFLAGTPAERRADLDGEVRRLDFLPAAHFVENRTDRRELALANVIARELLFLDDEHPHRRVVLADERARCCSARTAADDGNVKLFPGCLGFMHGARLCPATASRKELHRHIRNHCHANGSAPDVN